MTLEPALLDKLKNHLSSHNISNRKAALLCGVSATTVNRLMNGGHAKYETIQKLKKITRKTKIPPK